MVFQDISGTSNLQLPWCICSGECWVSRGCQGRRDWPRGFGSLRSLSQEKGNFGRGTMYKEEIENKDIKIFHKMLAKKLLLNLKGVGCLGVVQCLSVSKLRMLS